MDIRADVRPEQNHDLEGAIFNVSFDISGDMSLCVGMRYIGGNPYIPQNYRFDHANMWRDGIGEPKSISLLETRRLLRSHRVFLKDIVSYLE